MARGWGASAPFVGGKKESIDGKIARVRMDLWSCHSTGHLGGSLV